MLFSGPAFIVGMEPQIGANILISRAQFYALGKAWRMQRMVTFRLLHLVEQPVARDNGARDLAIGCGATAPNGCD